MSVDRWFVVGVIAAGLMLALVLPLGAGSEGFPTLVDCLYPSGRQAHCRTHVSGAYPAGSVLFRLGVEVGPGQGDLLRVLEAKLGPTAGRGLILCLRPGGAVFSCLRFENGQTVLAGAPNMLGMYVDAQPVPEPSS